MSQIMMLVWVRKISSPPIQPIRTTPTGTWRHHATEKKRRFPLDTRRSAGNRSDQRRSLLGAVCIQKLVGGPGFEPGASRSRTLGGLVHRDRFRAFELGWEHWACPLSHLERLQVPQLRHELLHQRARRVRYAVDHPPSEVTRAPLTFDASSLASHEISVAIWSGCAGAGIVAIESIARSMAQGTAGLELLAIEVTTGPGRTALDRIFFGP